MVDQQSVHDAADALVRDMGIAQAERDLQRRFKQARGTEQDKALAALAALRKGEVGR